MGSDAKDLLLLLLGGVVLIAISIGLIGNHLGMPLWENVVMAITMPVGVLLLAFGLIMAAQWGKQ